MKYLTRRTALMEFAAASAGLLLPTLGLTQTSAGPKTAQQVFEAIKSASGQYWNPNPTDDRIQFGDPNIVVTGIATCFFAPIETLRAARAAGLNYIIPHECTFYERYDDIAESIIPENDATLVAKMKFLRDNNMVVQRMHGHAHSLEGDFITSGLIEQLGWTQYRVMNPANPVICNVPAATAMEVGRHIKMTCGRRTLRMFGDPNKMVSTISVSAGMPGENAQIAQIDHQGVDAVLLGEVREPEVIGYAQDLAASKSIVVYLNGHSAEDYGMRPLASWMKGVFPELPVKWLPTIDPYTNPV